MKSLVITMLFALSLGIEPIHAQDPSVFSYVDEISIGLNSSNLFVNSDANRVGFSTGIYVNSPIEKTFQLQSGIEYNLFRTFKSYLYESHFSSTSSNNLQHI